MALPFNPVSTPPLSQLAAPAKVSPQTTPVQGATTPIVQRPIAQPSIAPSAAMNAQTVTGLNPGATSPLPASQTTAAAPQTQSVQATPAQPTQMPVQQMPMPPMQQQQPPQPPPMQQPAPAQQSVENQALNGGSNNQQVFNFMRALQGVNSSGSNAMQNTPANSAINQQGQAQSLYGAPVSAATAPAGAGPTLSPQQALNAPTVTGLNPTPALTNTSVLPINPITPNSAQLQPSLSPATAPRVTGLTSTPNLNAPVANNIGAQVGAGASMPSTVVSDEKAKTNISDPSDDSSLRKFLDNLTANKYDYKDKADGDKQGYVSPMAQDLEKSELGKTMVDTQPDGKKVVNYGRGFGIITAAQSLLHDRMSTIEKSLKLTKKDK
jgi:hypothetical protein